MKDSFGRDIEYLRLSVTDRCNLRCIYCMPGAGVRKVSHDDILTFDEIYRLTRLMTETVGIKKVRITGGEPLVRKDLPSLVKKISELELSELVLTTNGVLLPKYAKELANAGIQRVNISLDSIRDDVIEKITRRKTRLKDIEKAIDACKSTGMKPVKINCVVLKGLNEGEIPAFLEWSVEKGVQVRFIEHIPFSLPGTVSLSKEEILKEASRIGPVVRKQHELSGTAALYRIKSSTIVFGIISPFSSELCCSCNRLRLTAEGKLVSCMTGLQETDLRTPLHSEYSDEKLIELFRKVILWKPESGNGFKRISMWKIGG